MRWLVALGVSGTLAGFSADTILFLGPLDLLTPIVWLPVFCLVSWKFSSTIADNPALRDFSLPVLIASGVVLLLQLVGLAHPILPDWLFRLIFLITRFVPLVVAAGSIGVLVIDRGRLARRWPKSLAAVLVLALGIQGLGSLWLEISLIASKPAAPHALDPDGPEFRRAERALSSPTLNFSVSSDNHPSRIASDFSGDVIMIDDQLTIGPAESGAVAYTSRDGRELIYLPKARRFVLKEHFANPKYISGEERQQLIETRRAVLWLQIATTLVVLACSPFLIHASLR
jgi:hypothetical protein